MGQSVGHWEGDTFVVTANGFNDRTWFDRAGNFHSDALQVTERYTPLGPNAIEYEATRQIGLAILQKLKETPQGDESRAAGGANGRAAMRRAASLFSEALAMRPADEYAQRDFADAMGAVGSGHARAARFADAARCFQRAVQATPEDANLHRQLAHALQDTRGRDAAGRALAEDVA